MGRKTFIAAVLLLSLFVLAAAAEEAATPTDLTCSHEHTKVVLYFYDSPVYTPISAASHRVSGPATQKVVCLDCGEELSSEEVANAETVRPHSFKKGVCALCGYRLTTDPDLLYPDLPGERTLVAQETSAGVLTLTLTHTDLSALFNAHVATVLIRGRTDAAAVAVDVAQALDMTEAASSELVVEISEREDGSLFAGIFLKEASGTRTSVTGTGFTLRFYTQQQSGLEFVLITEDDEIRELAGEPGGNGCWMVPYVAEGNYMMLQ